MDQVQALLEFKEFGTKDHFTNMVDYRSKNFVLDQASDTALLSK